MSGWLGLAVVVVLIIANGLFVAAEFGLVSVRRSTIEGMAADGHRGARSVLAELQSLSFMLSGAQFGITASSLLVGFLAEDAIGSTITRPLVTALGVPEAAITGLSLTIALVLSTMAQMVIGELFPKNLAIARPMGVSLRIAPFMRAFGWVFGPIITVFDRSAAWMTEKVFRVPVSQELTGGHSLDELSRIIAASGEEGSLSESQARLLRRAVDLGDTRAAEVMIPRPDVVWLDADAGVAELLATATETGHSRFPLRGESDDDVVGTVHVKDVLRVAADQRASARLIDLADPPLLVPESDELRRLLARLRREHRTFAIVVDEYGGVAGMVTLEDVLEELVGDIEDEHDRDLAQVVRLGAGRFRVAGTLRADRTALVLGVELPEGSYDTVAGFVLDRLGHLPDIGEQVEHREASFRVRELDHHRIVELDVTVPALATEAT